ncbi:MAG: hypothetical protein HYX53_02575 [Chloroflexi bacterium]|nr:hypothetical protein [Chloroflexota bacterium]
MARAAGDARMAVRLLAGPLALAAFFLPWGRGPGPLAATEFSGYSLVGFAGRLQVLELSPGERAAVLAFRLLVLGLAVAGAWQTVLAPRWRSRALYRWSAWYLAVMAVGMVALRTWVGGVGVPPPGVALLVAAAACAMGPRVRWGRHGQQTKEPAANDRSTVGRALNTV